MGEISRGSEEYKKPIGEIRGTYKIPDFARAEEDREFKKGQIVTVKRNGTKQLEYDWEVIGPDPEIPGNIRVGKFTRDRNGKIVGDSLVKSVEQELLKSWNSFKKIS